MSVVKVPYNKFSKLGLFLVMLLTNNLCAYARLGETEIQCADRYGAPKNDPVTKIYEKASPLIEGGITHTYDYQGWQLKIAFLQLGGPAVRIQFSKKSQPGVSSVVTEQEITAILNANTPSGTTWTKVAYDNPNSPNTGLSKMFEGIIMEGAGSKTWKRTDGATAQVQSPMMMLLELPIARQYEAQIKQQKEQKARASVPTF